MKIERREVEHVAHLARLSLTPEETEAMRAQLDAILTYIDKLTELDTRSIEPTSHVVPMVNVLQADEPRPSLPQDEALRNAPDRQGEYFKVPRILED
ncbi:MAG: Asp-tRNA(Asn)/Glu-tRNA(Gln) amidotransferase subunit GatC [Candidatus Methylomirabilales bacterium]